MEIMVDGYNLIRQVPELLGQERRSLQDGRDYLVRELSNYAVRKRHHVTVVFDGPAVSHQSFAGVSIVYAPSADEYIIDHAAPDLLVVSSDVWVAEESERKGATACPVDYFWHRVSVLRSGQPTPGHRRTGPGGRRLTRAERRAINRRGRLLDQL